MVAALGIKARASVCARKRRAALFGLAGLFPASNASVPKEPYPALSPVIMACNPSSKIFADFGQL